MSSLSDKVSGAAKEAAGKLTDNERLQAEGKIEKVKGDAEGKVDAVKDDFAERIDRSNDKTDDRSDRL